MRPGDRERAERIAAQLKHYSDRVQRLPGLEPPGYFQCLVEQLIDSRRRIEFVHRLRDQPRLDPRRMDPLSDIFDPLRAAVLHYRQGNTDEAYWLVFVATHFGKHIKDGWRLARDVYGRLGGPGRWDWATISTAPLHFRPWLQANYRTLCGGDGISRRFSNHRKYETLNPTSSNGTADAFETYVAWVAGYGSHQMLIRRAHEEVGQHPEAAFDFLYRAMDSVQRFGRLGKFDFLTMLGKLGIAPIEPGSAYLSEATGPLKGARLLFTGDPTSRQSGRLMDSYLRNLDDASMLGKQTWEDALCNWQKSPARYISFRG